MDFGPYLLLASLEGAVAAAVLALTAVGLSLVFGVMRVVNVAHGEFFMLGAVTAWWIGDQVGGAPVWGFVTALVVAPLFVGAVAALVDRLVLSRLNYDPEATIVATIGILYILQQTALMSYGPEARPVEAPFSHRIYFPWFGYSTYKFFVVGAAAIVLGGIWLLMTRTRIGLLLRASQMDSEMARAFGVNVGRVYALTFGLGAGLAAMAAVLVAPIQQAHYLMGRPASPFLHRRHHRRARLDPRHGGRGGADRHVGRDHIDLLRPDAGEDPRNAACRFRPGLSPAGAFREARGVRGRRKPRSSTGR